MNEHGTGPLAQGTGAQVESTEQAQRDDASMAVRPSPRPRKSLPGAIIDLATDGVRKGNGRELVLAVRRVMLSAHRNGWTFGEVHELLTDTERRNLARQLLHQRRKAQVAKLLREHWDDTGKTVQKRPVWSADDVAERVRSARAAIDAEASALEPLALAAMRFVLDEADRLGTTKPAVPCRELGNHIGVGYRTALKVLHRLCGDGEWLTLVARGYGGEGGSGRANVYSLGPAIRRAHRWGHIGGEGHIGARSAPHMCPAPPDPAPVTTLTLTLTEDERRRVLTMLAGTAPAELPGNVVPLRPAQ